MKCSNNNRGANTHIMGVYPKVFDRFLRDAIKESGDGNFLDDECRFQTVSSALSDLLCNSRPFESKLRTDMKELLKALTEFIPEAEDEDKRLAPQLKKIKRSLERLTKADSNWYNFFAKVTEENIQFYVQVMESLMKRYEGDHYDPSLISGTLHYRLALMISRNFPAYQETMATTA